MKISIEEFWKIPLKQNNEIYEVENYGTIYYVNGKVHREDGPACDYINGDKCWFFNGKYRRLDGPAIEKNNGKKFYYIEGKPYSTKEEFDKAVCSYYMYKNGLQDYL